MGRARKHSSGLKMIEGGGAWRVLGALPSPPLTAHPDFTDLFSVAPRADWNDCSIKSWKPPILDQGQYGSCVGQATETAFHYAWKVSGQEDHGFSPTFIYGMINGDQDAGAQVSDGVTCIQINGTCLMSQVGQGTIYKSRFPSVAFTTAKRFKALSVYRLHSFDELCTAILRGFACISGIAVGTNFNNLSNEGICPLPNKVAGGHALCHIGLKKVQGKWVVETQNSWGRDWGLSGYCYLQEGAWDPRYGFPLDAWAITAVNDDPEESETDAPPVSETLGI